MNAPDIIVFLEILGCRQIRAATRVVRASCPFESKHPGGRDKHPSFAVKIAPGDESTFKCYTCSSGGDLNRLLTLLDRDRPMHLEYAKRLHDFVVEHDVLSSRTATLSDPTAPATLRARVQAAGWRDRVYLQKGDEPPKKPDPPSFMSESYLDDYFLDPSGDPSGDGLEYLTKRRGYTLNTIRVWELKWHPRQRRIAIPTRDRNKRLVGISGRAIDPGGYPKYLHSTGFPREFYLFGEHMAIPGTGILVEGQFDVIGLWQDGFPNGLGAFGSDLTLRQLEKIVDMFSDVVILSDGDDPGRKAAERWERQLRERLPVRVPDMPKGKDPDDLSMEEKIAILGEPKVVDNHFSLWDR